MDGAAVDEPPTKRARGPEPKYALVSCFDEPDRLQEVDLRILRPFQCRLYKQIVSDPPDTDGEGRSFWRCGMTRAMLQTLQRSMLHGELSLGRHVSLSEALTTLEYENVPVGIPAHRAGESAVLRPPPVGVAFQKHRETLAALVTTLAEQTAAALGSWPRLEAALENALKVGMRVAPAATPTRCWVRFVHKPMLPPASGDLIVALATKQPKWLVKGLMAIGLVHARLAEEKHDDGSPKLDGAARDVESYRTLARVVEADTLGPFFATRLDVPTASQDEATAKRVGKARRFAHETRQLVLSAAASAAGGEPVTRRPEDFFAANAPAAVDRVRFARACIGLADHLLSQANSPASVFSGACATEESSFERAQLAKALRVRGIQVVRWNDAARIAALSFPSGWAADASQTDRDADAPCVLLDFAKRDGPSA